MDLQPRRLDRLRGHVLEGEHDLEQRRPAEIAVGLQYLHELFEGQLLVCIGAQGHLAHALKQLGERWVSGQVAAQHEGVDEASDQVFELTLVPSAHRCAQQDVALGGVSREQHLERGKQRHEGGDAVPAAEGLQLVDQRRR